MNSSRADNRIDRPIMPSPRGTKTNPRNLVFSNAATNPVRTGEDAGGSGVHDLEGDIANGGHAGNPLRQGGASDRCVPKQIDINSEIISILILRRKGLTCRALGLYGILATL